MIKQYFVSVLKILSVASFVMLVSCGCWDKIELENRGFVNAIGIDKFNKTDNDFDSENNRFIISISLPSLDSYTGKSGSENKIIKTAVNETITAAMKKINFSSNQKLYFGQTKGVVLGSDLLSDKELMLETIDILERNREINRKIFILSSENKAETILEEDISDEPLVGMFVSNFYKNNSKTVAVTFRQDLINLIKELRINGSAIIPKIDISDKKATLGGAAVIKDYSLAGWLTEKETRGLLFFKGKADGAQISAYDDGSYLALSVSSQKSKISFDEDEKGLVCNVDINLKGTIEEYNFGDSQLSNPEKISKLTSKFEDIISQEVYDTFHSLQYKFQVDAIGLKDSVRKKNYNLYLQNENDWENVFKTVRFNVKTDLQITNTGSIR